jgi:uncharacterized protein (UPF0335 family)
MAGAGHNLLPEVKELRAFVEQIETLLEERKGLNDDLKDVKNAAKAAGFDTKTLMAVIRLRAQEAEARAEQKALLDTYAAALGLAEFC